MEERLRIARKSRGMTMKELSELLHVTESTVSKYEAGKIGPTGAVVEAFCQKLHISEHWLRTGEGEMEEPEAADLVTALAQEYNMDAGGVAILRAVARAFECLSPDQRDEILDVLFADLQAAIARRHAVDPAAHEVHPQAHSDPSSIPFVGSAVD